MKNLFIPLLAFLHAGSMIHSTQVCAQEVFGQDVDAPLQPVEIHYDDLPKAVRSVIERDEFSNMQVDKIYKVGRRQRLHTHHYTIRFKKGDEYQDVYLDENGNIIDPQDERQNTMEPDEHGAGH